MKPASLEASIRSTIDRSQAILGLGESWLVQANLTTGPKTNLEIVEALYEQAYLRVFVQWEVFLESTFYIYLCGENSKTGRVPLTTGGRYATNLAAAQAAVLGGRPFLLWHNVDDVVQRSRSFFASGPHERILGSASPHLRSFAAVRHRVTHGSQDVATKFDSATMSLAGKRYRGSRPGTFLRDSHAAPNGSRRWIVTIFREIAALAQQMM